MKIAVLLGQLRSSNHKNKLPIDGLDGACCSNQKTILRKNLEDRVLSCLPAAFFGMGVFDDVAGQARQNLAASMKKEPDERQRISGALKAAEQEQRQIIQQISIARPRAGRALPPSTTCSTRLRNAVPASRPG